MPLNLKRLRFKCAIGHGINDIYWFVLPSILPLIIEQFGLRYRAGGLILTAYLMVIALFSTILGKWSDSVDRQRIIGIGFLLSALGMTLAGVSKGLASFIALLIISAVGTSSFHPVGLALIDETAKVSRGRVFGFFEFWGFLAVCAMFFPQQHSIDTYRMAAHAHSHGKLRVYHGTAFPVQKGNTRSVYIG